MRAKESLVPASALGDGYVWLKTTLERKTTDLKTHNVPNSGHFIAEEQPEATLGYLADFLK